MGLCAPTKMEGTSSPLPIERRSPFLTPAMPSKKKAWPSPIYRPITNDISSWKAAPRQPPEPSYHYHSTRTTSEVGTIRNS